VTLCLNQLLLSLERGCPGTSSFARIRRCTACG
jgi:hypothetical protein